MVPWSFEMQGRLDEHVLTSEALRDNALGDPHERPLWVYLPPGYDDEPNRRYASVYVIQGLTGQLDMWRNRTPFRRNFPELADAMFAAGDAPPVVVVWVDCWTSLGGSQFLDSPGTGNYLTYLCDEIVPFVDANYRTVADRNHRGIQGKSSGTISSQRYVRYLPVPGESRNWLPPERGPAVDPDDDDRWCIARGEHRVCQLREVPPERSPIAPHVELTGEALDRVDRRVSPVRLVVVARRV